jgi:ribosomal protein L34E
MTEMPQCPNCAAVMHGFVKYEMAKSKIKNRKLRRILGHECPECDHRMIVKSE